MNETGINTVLTIMPPKNILFRDWHQGIISFTLGFIQMVARRQYFYVEQAPIILFQKGSNLKVKTYL